MPKIKHEPTLREVIGKNIKIMLVVAGLKQSDLAQRMNVTEGAVSHWISGRADMGLTNLEHVARILHTTPAKLLAAPEQVAENCSRLIC